MNEQAWNREYERKNVSHQNGRKLASTFLREAPSIVFCVVCFSGPKMKVRLSSCVCRPQLGMTILHQRRRPQPLLLLACQNPKGSPQVLGVACPYQLFKYLGVRPTEETRIRPTDTTHPTRRFPDIPLLFTPVRPIFKYHFPGVFSLSSAAPNGTFHTF